MAETQAQAPRSKKGLIIAALILIAALFILFLIMRDNGQYLHKIYKSYSKNAAVCMEKYDNQEVKFKCQVSYISSELTDISVRPVGDKNYSDSAYCTLSTDKLKKKAKKLKNGETIKIKGVIHVSDGGGRPYIRIDTEKIS